MMSTAAVGNWRHLVLRQLLELSMSDLNVQPVSVANDYTWAIVEARGPHSTPYEGANFEIVIQFCHQFPIERPTVFFKNKIWHVNVCSVSGLVTANSLLNWSTDSNLLMVFRDIYALLQFPALDISGEIEAKLMYENNYEMYRNTAAVWAKWFANGSVSSPDMEEKVIRLVREGASVDEAMILLSSAGWVLNVAYTRFLEDIMGTL